MKKYNCRVMKKGVAGITNPYEEGKHNGIDLVGLTDEDKSTNDYIVAHSDGIVKEVRAGCPGAESGGSYGNYVILQHDEVYATVYAHLKYGTVEVKKGDKVKKGAVLGYQGKTGTTDGGTHLHFEVRKNNKKVDPTPFIDADFEKEEPEEPEIKIIRYTVKKGDSYWKIARMAKKTYGYDGSYKDLQKYEANPAHIHPGDWVYIPVKNDKYTNVIVEGSLVTVHRGATNVAGVNLAAWVYVDTFVVLEQPENGKAKIGKIKNGIKRKTATMYLKDLTKVG